MTRYARVNFFIFLSSPPLSLLVGTLDSINLLDCWMALVVYKQVFFFCKSPHELKVRLPTTIDVLGGGLPLLSLKNVAHGVPLI